MIKKPSSEINKELSTASEEIKKPEVGKYLTEMKELPPETVEESNPARKPEPKPTVNQSPVPVDKENKLPAKEERKKDAEPEVKGKDLETSPEVFEGGEKSKLPFTSKDVILGVINLITIVFLIIILTRFPQKAQDLKGLRNQSLIEGPQATLETSEIELSKNKADTLKGLFLDESGVVNFVNEVEKIRAKGRSIVKVTFTSQKAIQDRTDNFGVPIVIEMKGSWEAIGQDLEDLEKLPFLYRSAVIEVKTDSEDPSVIDFKYGVFLYVVDRLGQTR